MTDQTQPAAVDEQEMLRDANEWLVKWQVAEVDDSPRGKSVRMVRWFLAQHHSLKERVRDLSTLLSVAESELESRDDAAVERDALAAQLAVVREAANKARKMATDRYEKCGQDGLTIDFESRAGRLESLLQPSAGQAFRDRLAAAERERDELRLEIQMEHIVSDSLRAELASLKADAEAVPMTDAEHSEVISFIEFQESRADNSRKLNRLFVDIPPHDVERLCTLANKSVAARLAGEEKP